MKPLLSHRRMRDFHLSKMTQLKSFTKTDTARTAIRCAGNCRYVRVFPGHPDFRTECVKQKFSLIAAVMYDAESFGRDRWCRTRAAVSICPVTKIASVRSARSPRRHFPTGGRQPVIRLTIGSSTGHRGLALFKRLVSTISRPGLAFPAERIVARERGRGEQNRNDWSGRDADCGQQHFLRVHGGLSDSAIALCNGFRALPPPSTNESVSGARRHAHPMPLVLQVKALTRSSGATCMDPA